MSTNYYAVTSAAMAPEGGLHIGQHAQGSVFLFRAHTDHGITTARTWYHWMETHDALIVTESQSFVDRDDFWADAQELLLRGTGERFKGLRSGETRQTAHGDEWLDELGYSFADYEFC